MGKRIYRTCFALITVIGLFLVLFLAPNQSVGAQLPTVPVPDTLPQISTPEAPPEVPELPKSHGYWRVEIDLVSGPGEVASMGGVDAGAAQVGNSIAASLQGLQVDSGVAAVSTSDGGAVYTITLEGYGADLLRDVLFVNLSGTVNVLGYTIELTVVGPAKAGDTIKFDLSYNPAAGSIWQLVPTNDIAETNSTVECGSVAPGVPQTQSIDLNALRDGELGFKLLYGRLWEEIPKASIRIFIQFSDLPGLFDLINRNLPFVNALPPIMEEAPLEGGAPPDKYDWSTSENRLGAPMVTGVRDQGQCGSCWSFGSVGVLESAIMIQGSGPGTNMAEQYLVSCNDDGWGCNGGWWAHDYHISKNGQASNPPGAVNEADYPYTGTDSTCQYVGSHPYSLTSWAYAGDSSLESVPAIKAAIEQYGPVAAAVCANGWGSYSGGVWDQNECSSVNHAIIIVGWDDATESWKIRNSWGAGWGEGGYMRIKWGVSGVGTAANYVVFGGGPVIVPSDTPTPVPTSTPTPVITSTPASGLGPGTYDDTDGGISFHGSWSTWTGNGPYNNTVHYSSTIGNGASFDFNGSQFTIGYTGAPGHGIMLVWVDESLLLLFNEFNWDIAYQREWTSPMLSNGHHRVTIQQGLGFQSDIDYISIY